MSNIDTIMNFLLVGAGLYLFYSAIMMKTKGEIVSGFISRNLDPSKVNEEAKKSFIKYMFPANLIMGVIMTGMGAIFFLEKKLQLSLGMINILTATALLVCVIYGIILMHVQNKYLKK
ncbi:MAG: hypothetical protein IJU43_01090 [Lachnospiraceae bacterium]|nr:hypothetical protein [Lachnospiraceae bacterium]